MVVDIVEEGVLLEVEEVVVVEEDGHVEAVEDQDEDLEIMRTKSSKWSSRCVVVGGDRGDRGETSHKVSDSNDDDETRPNAHPNNF